MYCLANLMNSDEFLKKKYQSKNGHNAFTATKALRATWPGVYITPHFRSGQPGKEYREGQVAIPEPGDSGVYVLFCVILMPKTQTPHATFILQVPGDLNVIHVDPLYKATVITRPEKIIEAYDVIELSYLYDDSTDDFMEITRERVSHLL